MTKRILLFVVIAALALATFAAPRATGAANEIVLWEAMGGNNGKVVSDLVGQFNSSHPDIHVTEQLKGASYNEVLNNVITASQQKQGPNIAQIFDLGTPLASDSGFFVPIESLLSADQLTAIKGDVATPVLNYFSIGGKLNSMPWN